MPKPTITRDELSEIIVGLVNIDAPDKIKGIVINPVVSPLTNWGAGPYWPTAAADGVTDAIVQKVVGQMQQDFEIKY
jgi:hypothetical protein